MILTLTRLLRSLSAQRKRQLWLLLGLMLVAAVAELVSLGAILPFLATIADPAGLSQRLGGMPYKTWLAIDDPATLRYQVTVIFVLAVLLSGLVRLALTTATARINFGIGHDIGVEAVRRTLWQPYPVHVARNSSEILAGLAKVDQAVFVIYQIMVTCSSLFIGACILVALLWIDARIALGVTVVFATIYGLVSFATRRLLDIDGQLINRAYGQRVQIVQEALGGIRDILLDHTQHVFIERFATTDRSMRRAQATNNIVGPSPRFVVETIGMMVIAILAYALTRTERDFATALPVLGALALGAQRLIPLLQQGYQGWVLTTGSKALLQDVVGLLEQPMAAETAMAGAPLVFSRGIEIRDVTFRYQPAAPAVLENISLHIPKGARVGFVGTTGSGKSTFMDLVMGLLMPSTGEIRVDGIVLGAENLQAWRRQIAHVPQAIYLSDASFAENIAFGVTAAEIDHSRVRQAAERAQIGRFIESNPQGYAAFVGERGVRLSGGQRQRIGVARALYKQASVLIFDEATSALDEETEQAMIESIEVLGRDLTVLMIAHRVSTLRGCEVIYRVEKGRLVGSGNYAQIQTL